MYLKYFLRLFIAFSFAVTSCNKVQTEITGTVKDFTGLDGCRLMIVLDSGERLDAVILPSNTTLIANRRIAITYKPVSAASICMAGTTVEVTSLRYL